MSCTGGYSGEHLSEEYEDSREGKRELKCHADTTGSANPRRPWALGALASLILLYKVGGSGFVPASITGCGLFVGRVMTLFSSTEKPKILRKTLQLIDASI